jgi:ADP-heptose:LPS heptosyltransferase/GT2 family glycosyltransferase
MLSLDSPVAWAVFDPAFYLTTTAGTGGLTEPEALLAHYVATGAAAGASPNCWFDEQFYRAAYPDVDAAVREGRFASGFDHYCQFGHAERSPHWLFSADVYRDRNPGLTDAVLREAGFVNGYDHYLKFGSIEGRVAHEWLDPAFYVAQFDPAQAEDCALIGAFAHFLTGRWTGWDDGPAEPRGCAGFDPAFYRAAYPAVAAQIRSGRWHSALHHYLSNRASGAFAPLPRSPKRVEPVAAPRIKINIDIPRIRDGTAVDPLPGHLEIVGWAAANHEVVAVDVFVDDEKLGGAHHGLRTEEVAAAFPDLTHGMYAGFRFIAPTPLGEGQHRARVVARGASGLEMSETFVFSAAPLAEVDAPGALCRRMRHSEAAFKLALLENGGVHPQFLVVVVPGDDDVEPEAARLLTLDSLEHQVYTRWRLHAAETDHVGDGADDWLVQLTAGDDLGIDALLELALHLLVHPTVDFVYSDERRIDPESGCMGPFFKPDWSPDLLLSTNYIGRLWAASIAVVQSACLEREDFNRPAYDLVLRLTEEASRIGHVPLVLCETAAQPALDAETDRLALAAALDRRGIAAVVEPGCLPHVWRVRRDVPNPRTVSVIIPTSGKNALIETALRTLRSRTDYPDIEVIVIDTAPAGPAAWRETMHAHADRVIEDSSPFNWSRLNNRAAAEARGAFLLFLNDDVAFDDPAWLHALMEHAQRREVAVTGPLLVYPDGIVQHAGVFLAGSSGRHSFQGRSGLSPGPFGLAMTQRNVMAVTGACMLVRREVFERLGRFDERFDVVNNNLDFCLRAQATGLLTVFTPHSRLAHHESATRVGLPEDHNLALFEKTWRRRLFAGDPWFNRNLSPTSTDYRAEYEPVQRLHAPRPLAPAATIGRILVIKLDHLGDFLLAVPAIRRIKERFPEAAITLLAAPASCALASIEPAIDEAIPFRFFEERSALGLRAIEPEELETLLGALRARRFDLAIDLRGHLQTRGLLRDCGATWLAGFDPSAQCPFLDIVAVFEPDTHQHAKRTHIADALVDLANRTGAAFAQDWQPLTLPADCQWPAALPEPPLGPLRVAVHPGAGTDIKQWPVGHFAALVTQLASEFAFWIVLVGTADEAHLADEILSLVGDDAGVVSAIGLTGPRELAALIGACDLFIGNDSGPHHLAAALGVPTIGIHSGVVDAREWGPVAPFAVALRRRVVCSPCYIAKAEDCPRALACLEGLRPSEVMDLVRQMVAGRAKSSRDAETA